MSSADLLLHPVRLRIVKTFLGDRALTTAQIAAELDDVPTASLYRHIATLTKAGVLRVVAERRLRGCREDLHPAHAGCPAPAGRDDAMPIEDHAQAFMAYGHKKNNRPKRDDWEVRLKGEGLEGNRRGRWEAGPPVVAKDRNVAPNDVFQSCARGLPSGGVAVF